MDTAQKTSETRTPAEAMLDMARTILKNAEADSSASASDIAFNFFFNPQRIRHRIRGDEKLGEPRVTLLKTASTNLEIKVYSWGQGKRVVCLHGWSGGGAQFRGFLPALVDSGHEVIVFDMPGHGESPGNSTDSVEIANLLLTIQQKFGELHGLICHSFGGIAAAYGVRNLGLRPGHLILIATPDPHLLYPRFVELMQIGRETAEMLQEKIRLAYLARGIDNHTNFRIDGIADELPVLLIQDQTDEEVPWTESQDLFERMGPATRMTTTGLGHYRILAAPQVIRRCQEFLAGDPT